MFQNLFPPVLDTASPRRQKKSDVFKVPDSPPPPHRRNDKKLSEIDDEMEEARKTRALTKTDLSILALSLIHI